MLETYAIQIDDEQITKQIESILNRVLERQLQNRYSKVGDEISAAVKELIYSRKDEIVDMVVDKATKEITRKALPKLLERMDGNG